MTKFKIGDRVKCRAEGVAEYFSCEATVIKVDHDGPVIHVHRDDRDADNSWYIKASDVVKLGKEVPPKFIATYLLRSRDPYHTFANEKDLHEWITEQLKNSEFVIDSLRVYPIGKELKLKYNWKLV